MATTVYTYNDKVLKNVATDKWLKKPDAPAGFVMNASNATITSTGNDIFVSWESPSYPAAYDGNGKQYIVVNNNAAADIQPLQMMYCADVATSGPNAIPYTDTQTIGTTTGTMIANPAVGGGYGVYLDIPFQGTGLTVEKVEAYLANFSITIVDP